MHPLLRWFAAVMMGLIVAFAITFGVEWVNSQIYPLPPGTDFRNPEALRAAMAALPQAALAVVLLGWFLSALAGVWMATRIARGKSGPALILGALLLAAAVANMRRFPHPVWFWVAALLLYPGATWLGAKWGGAPVTRPA